MTFFLEARTRPAKYRQATACPAKNLAFRHAHLDDNTASTEASVKSAWTNPMESNFRNNAPEASRPRAASAGRTARTMVSVKQIVAKNDGWRNATTVMAYPFLRKIGVFKS